MGRSHWIAKCFVATIGLGYLASVTATVTELETIDSNQTRSLPQWEISLKNSTISEWLKEGDEHFYEEQHDGLFPLEASDYLGFALCLLGLMLAAGGGIGGGGILIPIYILVMDFSPKHAIPLSNVTVLGGAVANILLYARQRHPLTDRPLIDWYLILVMEPVTIGGAVVGSLINSLLNETTIVILLIMLLSFTAHKTLVKAHKLYQKETREMAIIATSSTSSQQEEDENVATPANEQTPLVDKISKRSKDPEINNSETISLALQALLEKERTAPKGAIIGLVALFLSVFVINIVKGGGHLSPLGIQCGSAAFWLANGLILLLVLFTTLLVRAWLIRRNETQQRLGYQHVEGDIIWNSRTTIVYPSICFFAGLAAGMFGVGGGIVKGPLMLAMHVHPAVASATSATMILFTSTTATTSYMVFGLLLPQYAMMCFCFGFLATFLGQILLGYLMKRHARNSYIAFSIGYVVLLSAILMSIQSVLSILEGERHKSNGICGVDT